MNTSTPFSIRFQCSKKYRASVFFSIPFLLFLSGITIYFGIIDKQTPNPNTPFVIALAFLFFILALYFIFIIPRLYADIIVTEDGISQMYKNGRMLSISWNEISEISFRYFLKRIEISGENPKRTIFLETQIHLSDHIVDIIRVKVKERKDIRVLHRFP